jgi:hypothetical protein
MEQSECANLYPIFLSHMFGYMEQRLLGQLQKSSVFLKSNFFGSEKFQIGHFIPNCTLFPSNGTKLCDHTDVASNMMVLEVMNIYKVY